MFYTIQKDVLITAETARSLTRYYDWVKPLPSDYEQGKYLVENGELVLNPNFEEEKALKEKERIAKLYLTGADVERGIYQAKGMDFEDIIAMVTQLQPEGLDIKALKIELKANNFYRGNPYVSAVGTLLGFTDEMLDKFFETNDYTVLISPVEETEPVEELEDDNTENTTI